MIFYKDNPVIDGNNADGDYHDTDKDDMAAGKYNLRVCEQTFLVCVFRSDTTPYHDGIDRGLCFSWHEYRSYRFQNLFAHFTVKFDLGSTKQTTSFLLSICVVLSVAVLGLYLTVLAVIDTLIVPLRLHTSMRAACPPELTVFALITGIHTI